MKTVQIQTETRLVSVCKQTFYSIKTSFLQDYTSMLHAVLQCCFMAAESFPAPSLPACRDFYLTLASKHDTLYAKSLIVWMQN